jgi:hypothetical protein
MAYPGIRKNWIFDVNQQVSGSYTLYDHATNYFLHIKNALKASATELDFPWVVVGSNNCTTAALDGVDRLNTLADFPRWSAAPPRSHSWIVLGQPAIHPNFQVCFYNILEIMTVVVSPAVGFSGGSTSARPTASDEVVMINLASWANLNSSPIPTAPASYYEMVYNLMRSSDGEMTRVIFTWGTGSRGVWIFDKVQDAIPEWTNPSYYAIVNTTFASLGYTSEIMGYGRVNNVGATWHFLTNGCVSWSVDEYQFYTTSSFSGKYSVAKIILSAASSSNGPFDGTETSNMGAMGQLYDLWLGPRNMTNGTTYPEDGSRQYVQFSSLVFPWDGISQVRVA